MSDTPENGDSDDPVSKPHDWDRVVDAASVFLVDGTLAEAAKISGAGQRTISRWRGCSWWEDALNDAAHERLDDLSRFCLRMLLQKAREHELETDLAWKIIQRMDKRVPSKEQKIDHTSSDGSMSQQSVIVLPDNGRVDSEDSSNED